MNLSFKQLFLIDGLGALLSAFFLGVILVQFHTDIGMPTKTLKALAIPAIIFSIYSLYCYFRIKENWKPYMKIIALLNMLYCIITAALVVGEFKQLSTLGITYFSVEMVIVGIVVYLEIQMIRRK